MSATLPPCRAVVAGSLAFDHIMDFPGLFRDHILPEKLHVINISFLVERLERKQGGCGGNIAYTLALLGHRSRIVASAGKDFDEYRDWLVERGVDVDGIVVHPEETTASCFITTDRSDAQITGFYPGAMSRARELSLAALAAGAELAIVSPDDPEAMLRHCREARAAGIPFLFDPSFQVIHFDGDELTTAARGSRALFLNDYEYAVFREKTGLDEAGVLALTELVVVTLGGEGSRLSTRDGQVFEIPAARIGEVVDPTGAGDAYRGGFMAGLLGGRDLGVCGRLGSVAAGYAIESYGTQAHAYSREEFLARYEANFGALPGVG